MASTLRALNSIGGFSVGDDPQIVIVQANGDITASNITANGSLVANATTIYGNLTVSNANASWGVLTDNLYYSNGAPWDLSNPAGSTYYIQYNDGGSFGASANFQFNASTNTLQVTGTANVTGNINLTNYLNGNIGNFSGNLTAANANLGNLVTANYVNVASNLLVSGSANIVTDLQGNTANFSGNISALNANLGNLATANYINVSSNLKTSNLQVTGSVTSNLIPVSSNTYTLGNATNMWKDLYLSGTTIYIGTQNITANGTAIAASNDFGAANLIATNNVTASGNIYANSGGGAGYVYANFANVNSNLFVGGNANIVGTAKIYQEQLTSLSSTQIVYGNGSSFLVGSANFVFSDISNTLSVDNANLIGTLNGNVANFSGNLTALNANLGNLATANFVNVSSNLAVTGNVNFTSAANVSLGPVGNIHITGGSAGQVLQTDGAGNLSWSSTANINEIQNGTSNVMIATADGNVTITANGTYTWTFGTDGKLGAPGDITSAGTFNANNFTANSNITANGNLYVNTGGSNGYIYANYANVNSNLFVGGNANIVDTLTANTANVTTLNAANIATSGNITVNNATVNLELSGNTANFSGQVNLNANANVTNNLGVGGDITLTSATSDLTLTGGNISGANVISANTANISDTINGNIGNFSGNVTAANFIGTFANGSSNVRIDNGGNITFSPGTGYGNAVTISSGGIDTIGYVTANGNITSNTGIVSNNVTAFANTTLTLSAGAATGSANIDVTLVPTGNGTVNVSSKRITNLATPTQATDAVTKQYVDDIAQGLNVHDAANVATTGTLTSLTGGGTITYNNGTSGDGATLTLSGSYTKNFTASGTFDTGFTATTTNRILVHNESNAAYNGVYVVTSSTVLTRASDYNSVPEVEAGDFIFVIAGGTYAASGWVQTSVVTAIGTDPINFTQFSGAGAYTANTAAGLLLTGTVFSAKVDGNANPTIGFDGSGNLYVPASAHFTTPDVGAATGTSIDLTGNVLAGNVNSNALITAANLEVTGNILVGNITANANITTTTGTITASNANITTNLTANSANITNNLQGNTANFSGNLIAANANFDSGTIIAGTANISGNINGNVANFSGNLTAANANLGNLAVANYVNVSNNLNVTGTANIANVNISGNVTANNITSNNRVTATNIKIGNSYIYANTVTTTSTVPTEICSFMITNTDVYGIEYIIKSFDATGSKYSMATVQAVTNGTDVDYTTYATVRLGNTTGTLSVTRTAVSSDVSINLVATPSTGNSTTWTTQYRLI